MGYKSRPILNCEEAVLLEGSMGTLETTYTLTYIICIDIQYGTRKCTHLLKVRTFEPGNLESGAHHIKSMQHLVHGTIYYISVWWIECAIKYYRHELRV